MSFMSQRSSVAALAGLLALFFWIPSLSAAQQAPLAWGSPGVVAFLTDIAGAGTNLLRVNRNHEIDQDARLLVKSKDGSKYEAHYIARIEGVYVYLATSLKNAYSADDLLLQGCECDHALGLPADGVIGTLNEEVAAKGSVLHFTPIVPPDLKGDLLLKRKDGSFEEVHGIKSYDGSNMIRLDGKVKHNFLPGDMLIQGCLVPKAGGGAFPFTKLLLGAGAGAAAILIVTTTGSDECSTCP